MARAYLLLPAARHRTLLDRHLEHVVEQWWPHAELLWHPVPFRLKRLEVARAAACGRCEPMPAEAVSLAEKEGRIALPKAGSLEQLAEAERALLGDGPARAGRPIGS